jgi:hypothetical protein
VEVAGGTNVLVITRRKPGQIVQLIADNDLNGYYIHHRKSGKLVAYEFVGREVNAAIAEYEQYYANNTT